MGLSTVQNKYIFQDCILRLFSNITKTEKRQINGLIGVIHHIVIFHKLLEWKAQCMHKVTEKYVLLDMSSLSLVLI